MDNISKNTEHVKLVCNMYTYLRIHRTEHVITLLKYPLSTSSTVLHDNSQIKYKDPSIWLWILHTGADGRHLIWPKSQHTYSAKEMSPSPFVSNSMKKSEGAQCSSPGWRSPLSLPSLTIFDSEGGNTGTTALIKSVGNMYTSPSGLWMDAKYSKI
jgi:hypothetical protein